jgi:ABC-2 type transport system permease protein
VGEFRVWTTLAVAGYRRHATYRGAQLAGAATNTVFGLLRSVVLLAALASAGGEVAGYDRQTAIAFVFIGQALIAPVHVFPWFELCDRVRTGDIAVDFARPVDLQLQFGFADLGRAASTVLPNALPPLVVGSLVFGWFLPTDPLPYVLGVPAAVLAVGVSFACRFVVSMAAFWILEIRGVQRIYGIVSGILCGIIVPVTWFPDWLRTVAAWTPFPSFVQTPADVLGGRVTGWEAVEHVGVQLGWLVVLLAVGHFALRSATKRLVVQGG